MNYPDYFKVLGLNTDASIIEIKKAYRDKARMFHPDLNHSPDAKENFILATEAYEFLIANYDRLKNENAFTIAMEEWRRSMQNRSRQRASSYAHASYTQFRNTSFYRTTRIFDLTRIIFGLAISIIIIIYTILGFIIKLRYPIPEYGNNPVIVFILLMLLGIIFMTVSLIYLKAYIETSKKHRKKS